jgi:glycerophosphoryl diester phosphodiesterase
VILVAHRTPVTRAACEQLADAGATMFEADVQVGADGSVVVTHYLRWLAAGRVERDNWRLRWHTGRARDPRLADVAQLIPPRCQVLLDLKERAPERRAQLVAALLEAVPDKARFVVCGHPVADVDALRAGGFRTWRSIGNPRHLAAALAEPRLPDEAVTIRHTLIRPAVLERLRERVPHIVAWTVNNPARARRLQEWGADGITTDSIAVLHEFSAFPN